MTRSLTPAALFIAVGACFNPMSAARAADSIATDRPDFVESSDVVGKGRVQIETGLAFESNRTPLEKTRTRSTPTSERKS